MVIFTCVTVLHATWTKFEYSKESIAKFSKATFILERFPAWKTFGNDDRKVNYFNLDVFGLLPMFHWKAHSKHGFFVYSAFKSSYKRKLSFTTNTFTQTNLIRWSQNFKFRFKISLPKGHLFSTYAKFSEKLKFLDHWYAHVCAHIRGVTDVSFSETFTYVLNWWSYRHK